MFSFFLIFISSKVHLSHIEERQFLQWMRDNNKFYIGDDYHLRLGIFITNLRYCQEFNKRNGLTFTVGINQFSCHTPTEYKSLLGVKMNLKKTIKNTSIKKTYKTIPDSFDWRDKSVVNSIKDQANCGSCWAFSSIATSESAHAISSGKIFQFSEQNLIDCVSDCNGCVGGWPTFALMYVIQEQNGQFNSELNYPYMAVEGTCSFDKNEAIGHITNFVNVIENDEIDLKEKVANLGVASICIYAGNSQFMSYSGGILDNDDCINVNYVDHAVAVVGYGTVDGIDFWIVRNSWGTAWGEDGYVRMIRNKDNKCLIASIALVAVD